MGFQIGDKVRMKEDATGIDTFNLDENIIEEFKGRILTVCDTYTEGDFVDMAFEEDETGFSWNQELFELVEESEESTK